jgi:predicted nucleotidyltransferase component of viral defense system
MKRELAASVRARLLNLAKQDGVDFQQMLIRYGLERLLYRLSQSAHAEQFLLKGALLFTLWYDLPHRPTRDVDLLGFGASDLQTLRQTFSAIAAIEVDDGVWFDTGNLAIEEIRKDAGYAGARVVLTGELARARFKTQIDIGFGDAVTPGPVAALYPVLLADLPAPRLRTYPVYSVIAEKLHAIALLGMGNSRLKDYWDMLVIFERETLDQAMLVQAVAATFARREMALPQQLPIGLSDEFANDASRKAVWLAFLRKNELPWLELTAAVAQLRTVLWPVLRQAGGGL